MTRTYQAAIPDPVRAGLHLHASGLPALSTVRLKRFALDAPLLCAKPVGICPGDLSAVTCVLTRLPGKTTSHT